MQDLKPRIFFCLGIQTHVACVIGGYILSQFAKKLVDNYQAERDTRLRDYIIRHPELFPEPGNEMLFFTLKKRLLKMKGQISYLLLKMHMY